MDDKFQVWRAIFQTSLKGASRFSEGENVKSFYYTRQKRQLELHSSKLKTAISIVISERFIVTKP